MEKNHPPGIITTASIVGLLFAAVGLASPGLEAKLMLTVIPALLCVGLLVKKWWVCGLLYCIVFLLNRAGIFFGKFNLLAVTLCLLVVALFVRATIAAYKFEKETAKRSTSE